MNVHGVLLHVAGDALGSVGVMISAAIIAFTDLPQRTLADPLASLAIVLIIALGTIPLLRQSIHILLELVPLHVDLTLLRAQLLALPGVLSIHDLHVWTLDNARVVGSLHIIVDRGAAATDFRRIIDEVKGVLHQAGVHASTVQPEFVSEEVQRKILALAAARAQPLSPAAVAEAVAAAALALPVDADDVIGDETGSVTSFGGNGGTDVVLTSGGAGTGLPTRAATGTADPATLVRSGMTTPQRVGSPLPPASSSSYGSLSAAAGVVAPPVSRSSSALSISVAPPPRAATAAGASGSASASFYLDMACDEIICGEEACKASHCCPVPQSGPFTPPPVRKGT